jgi:hypothetical protein
VRFVEGVSDLRAVFQYLLHRYCAFFKAFGKRFAFDAFHHQIVDTVLMANIMEHTDVRMIQAGNGFRFAFEALPANRVRGQVSWENFDGDSTVEPSVSCAIDLSHPASA